MKSTIIINGRTMHVVTGMNIGDWKEKYGDNDDVWDVDLGDFLDGSIDVNEDIYYWYINGRLYETDMYVE